tara:strand:- start:22 stop:306 length:285 start_codon:yes stop_codon:yes gene_type:complete
MVIEVIYSHHLDEGRGMLEVEFSMCEDDDGCQDHSIEVEVEEIENLCDLYDEIDWYDGGDDEMEVTSIRTSINQDQLADGLLMYINQNKDILNQ